MSASPPAALDPAQQALLAQRRELDKKLRLARGLSLTNVVSLAVFAFISLALSGAELEGVVVGFALATLAWNEHCGRSLLIAADLSASRRLAFNQLALMLVVLLYCGWKADAAWFGPNPVVALVERAPELSEVLQQVSTETGQSLDQLGGEARFAVVLIYAVVAALSALILGLMSYYYYSLRGTLAALARLPDTADPC
jgi:hypothetical protein